MVTDAVNHILGLNPMGVFYEIGESIDGVKWQEVLLPVCPNMIGGFCCFPRYWRKGRTIFIPCRITCQWLMRQIM